MREAYGRDATSSRGTTLDLRRVGGGALGRLPLDGLVAPGDASAHGGHAPNASGDELPIAGGEGGER
jgi:hypothetical protein